MTRSSWKPQLKSGTDFSEVLSGLQKMIRRNKEREALILAQEMFDSGYHAAVARRLLIVACEDIGLANPTVVAQVYALCTGYLISKKDSPSGSVEPLALYMAIILLARSTKNRECDSAQIATLARFKTGTDSAAKVIMEHESLIVDCHTARGKARLASQAAETQQDSADLAMSEFLKVGAQLVNRVEVEGDPWGREVRELYGLPCEQPSAGTDGPHKE
jgi:replication-associated recombination protein RarA